MRFGGEEFLAVVRFVDRRETPVLAEKIRVALADRPIRLPDGATVRCTASLGYAAFPWIASRPRAIGWEEAVHLADVGLYAAKRAGRNTWVGVEAGITEEPERALRQLGENVDTAIEAGLVRLVRPGSPAAGSTGSTEVG